MNTLKDVYIDQLQDLRSANEQAREVTKDLAKAAGNADLRAALERGVKGIEQGRENLVKIIKAHGADPEGEHCKGMEGLVREARAHGLEAEFGSDEVRDAVIVTQYQRLAHYAIAGYGCVVAFAEKLGETKDARVLKSMLDAAHSGDQTMTEIAQSGVNDAAA